MTRRILPPKGGQGGLGGWHPPRRGVTGGSSPGDSMVPDAEFSSYYGRPVIKEPVWQAPDVAGYLFFGGLAGASSVLAASAHLSGHRELSRVAERLEGAPAADIVRWALETFGDGLCLTASRGTSNAR